MKLWSSLLIISLLSAWAADAGTIIYKTRDGATRISSKVKILSIDGRGVMVLKMNNGTHTMPTQLLLRYYDTDINTTEQLDDGTADYTVTLRTPDFPESISADKAKDATFKVDYTTTRKQGEPQKGGIRVPYFYLYVLTGSGSGERELYTYSYPKEAKLSLKRYDEAKMLEKVIHADRPISFQEDTKNLGKFGDKFGGKTASFPLSNLKGRRIIAYYLVVWNKSEIVAEKHWNDSSIQSITPLWWYQYER